MIVRDEQDVLAESLRSVQPIADEIVVLDTGSTDRTPAVAQEFGAKVIRADWTDDFSSARNQLLEHLAGDWILWLDAGEQLDDTSAAPLREWIDQEADPRKIYMLMVEAPPAEPGASSERAVRPRLIPRHPGLRFDGRVRETVLPAARAAGLDIDTAPGTILRHARQHDPQRKAQRARRDLELIALEKAGSASRPPRLLIARGEALANLGEQDQAREAFGEAVRTSPCGSTEMLEAYYGLLTTYDSDPSQRDEQLNVGLAALEIYPFDAQLLLAMGSYLQARDRVDLAAQSFRTAVEYGQINPEIWHLGEVGEVAAVCLNLALQLQGKDDEACAVLTEALGRHPRSERIRQHLIDLHVKHGREHEAVRLTDALSIDAGQREAYVNAVRGACKAAVRQWEPALGYLQSAYLAGCHSPFCLRWLAVTLLSNGEVEAAEPVLKEWHELEPHNVEVQQYLAAIDGQLEPNVQTTIAMDGSRRIRIDPPVTVLDVGSLQRPIIGQASTADAG
jgi:Flp pilus assembly protein TadD